MISQKSKIEDKDEDKAVKPKTKKNDLEMPFILENPVKQLIISQDQEVNSTQFHQLEDRLPITPLLVENNRDIKPVKMVKYEDETIEPPEYEKVKHWISDKDRNSVADILLNFAKKVAKKKIKGKKSFFHQLFGRIRYMKH